MRIWNGVDHYPPNTRAVATIGNYDGVHLGHRAILKSVADRARDLGEVSLLITFDPHPLSVVAPERRPRLIDTRRQKLEQLESTGLDAVLILSFTPALAALSGERFFDEVLGSQVLLSAVHVGANFRFGRGRSGGLDLLRRIGAERGFDVVEVPAVSLGDRVVSSSTIRALIGDGDVTTAGRMLGRSYALLGEVVPGDGRGRGLSFPTANLRVRNELVPKTGVYVTETFFDAMRYPSVTNVGTRPTFDDSRLTVETHLLDFEGDLYSKEIEVRFMARIRDESRFPGPDALSDQIARDLAATVAYFENVGLSGRP
jgi:riboflavin kinase/FMN adenylyltransferase